MQDVDARVLTFEECANAQERLHAPPPTPTPPQCYNTKRTPTHLPRLPQSHLLSQTCRRAVGPITLHAFPAPSYLENAQYAQTASNGKMSAGVESGGLKRARETNKHGVHDAGCGAWPMRCGRAGGDVYVVLVGLAAGKSEKRRGERRVRPVRRMGWGVSGRLTCMFSIHWLALCAWDWSS